MIRVTWPACRTAATKRGHCGMFRLGAQAEHSKAEPRPPPETPDGRIGLRAEIAAAGPRLRSAGGHAAEGRGALDCQRSERAPVASALGGRKGNLREGVTHVGAAAAATDRHQRHHARSTVRDARRHSTTTWAWLLRSSQRICFETRGEQQATTTSEMIDGSTVIRLGQARAIPVAPHETHVDELLAA